MSLIWVDWLILGVIIISSLISLKRGFFKESLSLITWALAAGSAWLFGLPASDYLQNYINSPTLRLLLTSVAIFVAVLISGGIVSRLVNKLIVFSGFSGTDRALGMLFGALRGGIFITVIAGFGSELTISNEVWWNHSRLLPHFEIMADWSKQTAEEIIAPLLS